MRTKRHPLTAIALLAVLAALADTSQGQKSSDRLGQAKAVAAKQLKALGEGYQARIDTGRHIVYVSALDREHLNQTIRLVSAYIDAQQRTLLTEPLRWNLTILLPTSEDYKTMAPAANVIGFYTPRAQRVTSIDRGRVLLHEFTHAMHHADMAGSKQIHPPWICEGLATLFENAQITPAGLKPQIDARLIGLQAAIRNEKTIALSKLLTMGQESFMAQGQLAYAQSRYFMYYLYSRQRLKIWYSRYKQQYASDPDGAETAKWALGGRIDQIEKDWHKWILQQKLPYDPRRGQASLGLQIRDTRQGVRVVAVLEDSAAQTARRLKEGDYILTFNGSKVINTFQLAALIRKAGANRTATLTVKRNGRTMQVRQPLGAAGQ